ncbi:unnamed protein product [Urochloa humidicola]
MGRWCFSSRARTQSPTLCTAVSGRTRKTQTQESSIGGRRRWVRAITGTLTVQMIMEYLNLWRITSGVRLWSGDGQFSTKSAYNALHHGSMRFRGANRIWKTWAAESEVLWLASRRRLWTADRRRRHGLDARDDGWLCDQEHETTDHISSSRAWWHVLTPPLAGLQLRLHRRLRAEPCQRACFAAAPGMNPEVEPFSASTGRTEPQIVAPPGSAPAPARRGRGCPRGRRQALKIGGRGPAAAHRGAVVGAPWRSDGGGPAAPWRRGGRGRRHRGGAAGGRMGK